MKPANIGYQIDTLILINIKQYMTHSILGRPMGRYSDLH